MQVRVQVPLAFSLTVNIILSLLQTGAVEPDQEYTDESLALKFPEHFNSSLDCRSLQPGQYICQEPEIDNNTQQAIGCTKENPFVPVPCMPIKGIYCDNQEQTGDTIGFIKTVPCKWTNGKKFGVAVLLSVFLGWLGIDRFYLGYPALGLVKFCTFGFMFLWHLVDILLIAIQVVGPADGSQYIVDYYGPGLNLIRSDNETYIRPAGAGTV